MILLDTNVVSEAMKQKPHPVAMAWLNAQSSETLYLSSVTLAEMLFGLSALPSGKRKEMLNDAFNDLVHLFEGRILSFDVAASRCYADLAVVAKSTGRGFPVPDGYIAAIAVSHGFKVASRDTAPFAAAGVSVINPWG